jgi:hypothetical protein
MEASTTTFEESRSSDTRWWSSSFQDAKEKKTVIGTLLTRQVKGVLEAMAMESFQGYS